MLRGRGFWILIGSGALASVLIYAVGVIPMKAMIEKGKKATADETARLHKDKIAPKRKAAQLGKRKDLLDRVLANVQGDVRETQTVDHEKIWEKMDGGPPKVTATLSFWYRHQCRRICSESGSICRPDPFRPELHGIPRDRDFNELRRKVLLRRLTICREVHRTLAGASASVNEYIVEDGRITAVSRKRKVEKIIAFYFLNSPKRPRETVAHSSHGASQIGPQSELVRFRAKISFTIEFLAHINVVPEVLRGLGNVKDSLILIHRVEIIRPPETMGERPINLSAVLTRIAPVARNTAGREEPPAFVVLECEAVEYVLIKRVAKKKGPADKGKGKGRKKK